MNTLTLSPSHGPAVTKVLYIRTQKLSQVILSSNISKSKGIYKEKKEKLHNFTYNVVMIKSNRS